MAFLNIASKHKSGVLKDIDRQGYFNLNECTRLDLYTFAAALGYRSGYATDIDGGKESLVREEYTKDTTIRHTFSAVFFAENEATIKTSIEELTNTEKVFALMDKYANTGFGVLADYMKEYDDNALMLKLLAEMDRKYSEYQEERKKTN